MNRKTDESRSVIAVSTISASSERTSGKELAYVLGRSSAKRSKSLDEFLAQSRTYAEVLRSIDLRLRRKNSQRLVIRDFRTKTHGIVSVGERVLAQLAPDRRGGKFLKEAFRGLLYPWYDSNPFIQRGLWKPRGYAGDYMMMEMGYRRETSLLGGLAGQFDLFFFDRYQSILNRKEIIKGELRKVLAYSRKPYLDILTLGGGSSREWIELDLELKSRDRGRVRLSYLDQDVEAVEFSRRRLAQTRLIRSADFFPTSLLQFRDSPQWTARDGSYDFVYALGIADYFPDGLLIDICQRALSLVRRGGSFLITHKDSDRFSFPLLDWVCDWRFVHRDAEKFRSVVEQAVQGSEGRTRSSIERDATGEILFIKIERLI
jgi:hypothetical protein